MQNKEGSKVQYNLNIDTGKLHIEGYCRYASKNLTHVKVFETEDDAVQHAGKHILMYRVCEEKKEKILNDK